MCDRRDARMVQDAAADELTRACARPCRGQISLRHYYNRVVGETIPENLLNILWKL